MNDNHAWQRRHAAQIVAALPEDTEDALLVLKYARQLVEEFLVDDGPGGGGRLRVVPSAEVTAFSGER
jgi:hypothetical protein